jgi:hypothetical protein
MKLKLSVILLLSLATTPANAAPNWLTGLGHEVKQTGIDLVTWRHPAWNLMVMAEIGADLADAKTTSDCQRYIHPCFEHSAAIYGQHPDFKTVALTDIGTSLALATASHWMHTHTPRPYIKTADYWWLIPQTIDIVGTSWSAYHNAGLNNKFTLLQPIPSKGCHLDIISHECHD